MNEERTGRNQRREVKNCGGPGVHVDIGDICLITRIINLNRVISCSQAGELIGECPYLYLSMMTTALDGLEVTVSDPAWL